MSLESKHYLASPTEVEAITRAVLEARTTGGESRASYLKALVAKTQSNLGQTPRAHAVAVKQISKEQRAEQLAALKTAHIEYYAIVKTTVSALIKPGKARNSATNFARTSLATVVKWVRAGNDVTCLAPSRVTKYELEQAVKKQKAPSQTILANRVTKYLSELRTRIAELSKADKAAAHKAAVSGAAELTALALDLGGRTPHRGTVRAERRPHVSA